MEPSRRPRIDDYVIKIGDMGFAKEMASKQDLSKTWLGTPLNMAPEMLRGKEYSANVDIWSFGVITYQVLVGSHPFNGRSLPHLRRNVESGKYKIPSHI